MFGIGTTELMIVLGIGILLFGSKLPSIARSLGSSISEFKHGINHGLLDEKPEKLEQEKQKS